jgi:hypothetical protein
MNASASSCRAADAYGKVSKELTLAPKPRERAVGEVPAHLYARRDPEFSDLVVVAGGRQDSLEIPLDRGGAFAIGSAATG